MADDTLCGSDERTKNLCGHVDVPAPVCDREALEIVIKYINRAIVGDDFASGDLCAPGAGVRFAPGTSDVRIDGLICPQSDFAVARVNYKFADRKCDFYPILYNRAGWKVYSIRRTMRLEVYESRLKDGGDEFAWLAPGALIGTKAGRIENAKLMLSSDSDLRSWLIRHADQLGELALELMQDAEQGRAIRPSVRDQIDSLGLRSVDRRGRAVWVTIGGFFDEEVGFIYSPIGDVPAVSDARFFWVENVSTNWWLYRAT